MPYLSDDEFDVNFDNLNAQLHYSKKRMERKALVVRKREYIHADELDGYEAYINNIHWIFGIGNTPKEAIDDLKTRLMFEDLLDDDFHELPIRRLTIGQIDNG